MQRKWFIALLLFLFVLLLNVYFYFSKNNSLRAKLNERNVFHITFLNKEDITEIKITKSRGASIWFKKTDKGWIVNNYKKPEYLNQEVIKRIVVSLSNVIAEKVVEESADNIGKYGLLSPFIKADVKTKSGEKITLYVGEKTPDGNTYYLIKEGNSTVYAVWNTFIENLDVSLFQILNDGIPEIDVENFKYLYIRKKNEKPIEIVNEENYKVNKDKVIVGTVLLTKPYKYFLSVDSEEFSKLLNNLSYLQPDGIVGEVKDLSLYELDEPMLELKANDNKNSLHLLFGKIEEGRLIYFRKNNSNIVYYLDLNKVEPFLNVTSYKIVEKFAHIFNIDVVKCILIETESKEYTIEIDSGLKNESTRFFINGRKIDEDKFRKYYQEIVSVMIEGEVEEKMKSIKPDVKIKFVLSTGREVNFEYIPYKNDFYALSRDGEVYFVVSKEQVKRLIFLTEQLLKNSV